MKKTFALMMIMTFSCSVFATGTLFYGMEGETSASPDPLAAKCESVLSQLEAASGFQIQNPQLRRQLIEKLKAEPELTLLQLMAARASSPSKGLDEVIQSVISQLSSQARPTDVYSGYSSGTCPSDRPTFRGHGILL